MVLVGYWPLNESSGTKAYDHSGNENHGTINNGGDSTVPGASGVLGQNAYSFDGSNDYVSDVSNPLEGLETFTLCFWAKRQGQGSYMSVYGADDTNDANASYAFRFTDSDEFEFKVQDGSDTMDNISNKTFGTGNWSFIALTYGSSQGTIFVDASKDSAESSVGAPTANAYKPARCQA